MQNNLSRSGRDICLSRLKRENKFYPPSAGIGEGGFTYIIAA